MLTGWIGLLLASLLLPPVQHPALLRTGSAPEQPRRSPGGHVFLELAVSSAGSVTDVCTIRETPRLTEATRRAAGGWRFAAATEAGVAVDSRVLVAAVFRSASLEDPGLPESTHDVGWVSDEIPFPQSIVTPQFPFEASGSGVVVVEAWVSDMGEVRSALVVVSADGFDAAALDAAWRWTFRPAIRNGVPTPSVVYLVFGFQQPAQTVSASGTSLHA